MTDKAILHINIDSKLKDDLKIAAKKENRSLANYVETALFETVGSGTRLPPRSEVQIIPREKR